MTRIKDLIADCEESLGAVMLSKIGINKKARTMSLVVSEKENVTDAQLGAIKEMFVRKFRLTDIRIDAKKADEGENAAAEPTAGEGVREKNTADENAAAKENAEKDANSDALAEQRRVQEELIKKFEAQIGANTVSEIITGRKIQGELLPLSEVTSEAGRIRTSGMIFYIEYMQRRDNSWIVTFDITDKKDSRTVKLFCDIQPRKRADGSFGRQSDSPSKEKIEKRLKKGVWISVYGDAAFDKYSRDTVITAYDINELPAPEIKKDDAPEKRVELHMHTQMSAMDGVSSATALIERAAKWGHKAVAVTDHGVVQAYPEAAKAAKANDIKVIYGVEGYVVDDKATIVTNVKKYSLDDTFVVFDLETTGLSAQKNHIIEIGAVKIKGGEIVDSFSTFVEPPVKIPQKITELTSITDSMVKGAPKEEKAVGDFLKFCGESVLVAHNASFDTGFIRVSLQRRGESFSYCFIDTVSLARKMYPELKSFKLNSLAKHLKVKLDHHHRAVDDALATAYIFKKMLEGLHEMGVDGVEQINTCFGDKIDVRGMPSHHIIVIAKNPVGLENLYRLISESHLNYFYRTPRMPKSIINKYRDGLLIGSACEAGELYQAVFSGKSEQELDDIVSFYDYLEIQPLGNNEFMLRNGSVGSVSELQDINKKIIELGKKHNKLTVATCDVHFLDPEDEVYRRVLMAGKGFDDADFQAPLYLRTTQEMLDEFSYLDEETAYEVVIKNPNLISDMTEVLQPVRSGTYPPSIDGAQEDIINRSHETAEKIYGTPLPSIVKERMDKELASITKYGFSVMYKIAQQLVSKSLSDGYLVGSRGSVGSSFIAFLSGITEVNALPAHYICKNCKHSEFIDDGSGISGCDLPDKVCPVCGEKYAKDGHDIPFETFLGFAGDKEPDIDLNFSGEYQSVAHKYTEELFGEGHVFRAGTIGTIAEKTARGYALKYFSERGKNAHNAEIRRISLGCTGVKRTTGQHPGGVIIVPKANDIHQFCPVQHPADDADSTIITTHFDYHSIHDNLLKLDILGHDDPTVIRMLEDLIGKEVPGFDAKKIPLDDKPTLSLFLNTDALGLNDDIGSKVGTFGVPEFGTEFVRQMLIDTEPTKFSELLRISGLSHGTDVWLNNAQDYIRSGEIVLSEAICTRDDIMIYLIHMGLEPKTAFTIMEKVRKGKGLTAEDEAEMKAHDVPQWYIDSCNKIKYMFPKAHAVAYVMMAFRIAYCKVHYPIAYYCAYFTIRALGAFDASIMCHGKENVLTAMKSIKENPEATQKDKDLYTTLELCREMYARGFDFADVDLYKSDSKKFLPYEGKILPPLSSLPNVSIAQADAICEERAKGEFHSVEDLHMRTKISKTALESLELGGCFSGIPESSQMSLEDLLG
mgnify:FL=1